MANYCYINFIQELSFFCSKFSSNLIRRPEDEYVEVHYAGGRNPVVG